MPQSPELAHVTRFAARAKMHSPFQGAGLTLVDRHGVAERQHLGRLLIRQAKLFSTLRGKMQLISNVSDRIPYGICNAVLNLRPNQWRALVQQYGPVFAFQQARLFGARRRLTS